MGSELKNLNEKEENQLVLYKWLGNDINSGEVTDFEQAYEYVSRSKLAEDLNTNKGSFLRTKADNGQLWRIRDILKFCTMTSADPLKVCSLLFKHGK